MPTLIGGPGHHVDYDPPHVPPWHAPEGEPRDEGMSTSFEGEPRVWFTWASKRKQVWAARVILLSPLGGLLALLWSSSLDTYFWPLGHVHNALEEVGVLLLYGAAAGAAVVFAIVVVGFFLCGNLCWAVHVLSRTATRRPHRTHSDWFAG